MEVDLTKVQVQGRGSFTMPRLTDRELEKIRRRYDMVEVNGRVKADIFRLLHEIGELRKQVLSGPGGESDA